MAVNKIKDVLADLLFPRYCLNCRQTGQWLCESCLKALPSQENKVSLPESGLEVTSLFDYKEPIIDKVVAVLKYNFAFDVAPIIQQLISQAGKDKSSDSAVLVPVPLHRRRYLWRGFNQAEIIARALAASNSNWLVCPDLLKRVVYHPPQVGQAQKQREQNVVGAFRLNLNRLSDNWDKKIILVDDVLTTGSTLNECAKTIKAAGLAKISGFVLAK